MAKKDKLPAKSQFQINKDMLDEMAGKPGTPVKPPKATAKSKVTKAAIVVEEDGSEVKAEIETEVKAAPQGDTTPQEWDTYSQGKWKCNDCDVEFRHFCPQLSSHMSKVKHNFSLVDAVSGEVKATSLSEARSRGFINKTSKKKKRKNPTNQIGAGTTSPAAPQKKAEAPQLSPELAERVARFMADNPDLVQWMEQNPGQAPPTDLSLEGSPQPGSPQVLKFVAKTIEVPSILLVFYQMDLASLQEEGCQPTLDEWVEQVIVQFHVDHAEELGFADFIKKYMEGR